MTTVRVSLLDLYVLRGAGPALECLTLRRGPDGRCPGSWETVHGHIEPGESVEDAACREVLEEAGVVARIVDRLGRIDYGAGRIGVCAQFFLMEFVSEGTSSEGRRRAWLSLDEAIAAMPFDDTKQLLRDAHDAWLGRARGDERT